jgi:hypothetical protein
VTDNLLMLLRRQGYNFTTSVLNIFIFRGWIWASQKNKRETMFSQPNHYTGRKISWGTENQRFFLNCWKFFCWVVIWKVTSRRNFIYTRSLRCRPSVYFIKKLLLALPEVLSKSLSLVDIDLRRNIY